MSHREIMEWDAGKAPVLDATEREQDVPAGKVLEMLSLQGTETVIDCGAGTGQVRLPKSQASPTSCRGLRSSW